MGISIFTWNIEQFGAKRAQYDNRRQRVCELIAREAPDVAVIIEVKTTKTNVAIDIADQLLEELRRLEQPDYRYVITHSNFLEIYLFLYNSARMEPWVIPSGRRKIYTETELASLELEAADKKNTRRANAETLTGCFPLLSYPGRKEKHRPLGAAFFREKRTGSYYALVAWHNEAGFYTRIGDREITSDKRPRENLAKLATAPMVTNGRLTVTLKSPLGSIPTTIDNVVITGDFNVNFDKRYKDGYAAYLPFGAEAGRVAIGAPTYLNKKVLDGAVRIFSSCYDNFLLSPAFSNQHKINAHVWEFVTWFNGGGAKFLKSMINESDLTDGKALTALAVDAVSTGLAGAAKLRTFGYIRAPVVGELVAIINSQPITRWRRPEVRKKFVDEATEALGDHAKAGEIVETLVSWLDDQRADYDDTLSTYSRARTYPTALDPEEKAALVINILSDHVPVTLLARS